MKKVIKELNPTTDAEAFFEHIIRITTENGTGLTPIFTTLTPNSIAAFRERRCKGWGIPLSEAGWIKTWVIWGNEKIIAHVECFGANHTTHNHRVMLGMAMEAKFYRQGLGKQLLKHAIDWTRSQGFTWLDLNVFANNIPALSLYKKFGFEQVAYVKDKYKTLGTSVDDVQMTMRL